MTYLPENQVYISVGIQSQSWQVTVAARYTDEMRTKAGAGAIPANEVIEAKTLVDLSARYFLTNSQEIYLNVDNLFDETYMTTRVHGSIFAGKPQTVTLGYSYKF